MKKILVKPSTFIVLTLLLGFVIESNEVKAATTSDGFEYECDYYHNTATIYGYTGNDSTVVFPSEIDGCKVTRIAAPDYGFGRYGRIFKDYETITAIVIPDTVEEIGRESFFQCKNLKTVKMSKNMKKIDHEAFRRCYALEKIELPASLEELGEMAFMNAQA